MHFAIFFFVLALSIATYAVCASDLTPTICKVMVMMMMLIMLMFFFFDDVDDTNDDDDDDGDDENNDTDDNWDSVLLLPLNDQHHYVDDSVVRRLSRAGNWWVRDRDHHSESTTGYTFTPCVGYFTSPGIDTM